MFLAFLVQLFSWSGLPSGADIGGDMPQITYLESQVKVPSIKELQEFRKQYCNCIIEAHKSYCGTYNTQGEKN